MINNGGRDVDSDDDLYSKNIKQFSERVPDDQKHLRSSLKKMKREVNDLVRDDETFDRRNLGNDDPD